VATHDLQKLLATLEQRFGSVTGDAAEANTIATYTDGFLDCLRWISGQTPLRDPEGFGYIMAEDPDNDDRASARTTETVDSKTTTVDIVIRLQVTGSAAEVAKYRDALECLADVMRVQAEDGLWSLGHEDAVSDDGPSEYIADIETTRVEAILIEGADELTKDLS
jgi:hypothetical protein